MQAITILGATGSIGKNTLNVIAQHPDKFSVYALTANHNTELLLQQCQQFQPHHVVIVNEQAAAKFIEQAQINNLSCEVHVGSVALAAVASANEVEIVMAAIVGAAGLLPTLAAANAGKKILLANKEALVITGKLFIDTAKANDAEILPVDSEHNAIFQCLPENSNYLPLIELGVKRLILTASGGPFRCFSTTELQTVTPEQACAHPNWVMGEKVSVDSATLMNKGLEVIEAHWLFNANVEQIEAIIQPQSIIHSMVEYIDGSVLAELGVPDMRTPIASALGFPERLHSGANALNFKDLMALEFQEIDFQRFPCMGLAYNALEAGGTATVCLNAANEVAVEAFLQRRIGFMQIAEIVAQTLNTVAIQPADELEAILAVDVEARNVAEQLVSA